MASIIRLNFNKVAQEAETDEERREGFEKELSKLEKLSGPNWREAFEDHGEDIEEEE